MGMQSHLNCAASNAWGDTNSYLAAMDKYLNLGLDVQVTELDLSRDGGYTDQQQADKYKAIFKHCMDWNASHPNGPNVTLVQVWGPNDNNSWVGTNKSGQPNYPLLYDGNNQPKSAYSAITSLVPDSQWGEGLPYKGPGSSNFTIADLEPDSDGYWFHSKFEGSEDNWGRQRLSFCKHQRQNILRRQGSPPCSGQRGFMERRSNAPQFKNIQARRGVQLLSKCLLPRR
jgi:arabinoxylan arabinofuranohydrolase